MTGRARDDGRPWPCRPGRGGLRTSIRLRPGILWRWTGWPRRGGASAPGVGPDPVRLVLLSPPPRPGGGSGAPHAPPGAVHRHLHRWFPGLRVSIRLPPTGDAPALAPGPRSATASLSGRGGAWAPSAPTGRAGGHLAVTPAARASTAAGSAPRRLHRALRRAARPTPDGSRAAVAAGTGGSGGRPPAEEAGSVPPWHRPGRARPRLALSPTTWPLARPAAPSRGIPPAGTGPFPVPPGAGAPSPERRFPRGLAADPAGVGAMARLAFPRRTGGHGGRGPGSGPARPRTGAPASVWAGASRPTAGDRTPVHGGGGTGRPAGRVRATPGGDARAGASPGGALVHPDPGPDARPGTAARADGDPAAREAPARAPGASPSVRDAPPPIDLSRLTDEIYGKLEERLRMEKERRGL